jgi:hypothetical protein
VSIDCVLSFKRRFSSEVTHAQVITNCAAQIAGGGVFWRGYVEVISCVFEGNKAGKIHWSSSQYSSYRDTTSPNTPPTIIPHTPFPCQVLGATTSPPCPTTCSFQSWTRRQPCLICRTCDRGQWFGSDCRSLMLKLSTSPPLPCAPCNPLY